MVVPKVTVFPLTVAIKAFPFSESPLSLYAIKCFPTFGLYATPVYGEFEELKTAAVPKEILVPLTVPTIAVPCPELPVSLYAISILLALVSYDAFGDPLDALSKVYVEPNVIASPLTVPTIALPWPLALASNNSIPFSRTSCITIIYYY